MNTEGVDARVAELMKDPHVHEKVRDSLRVFELTGGLLNMPSFDDVLRSVCSGIALLEANPTHQNTWGQVMVVRGPMDGFSFWVRTADVYNTHLESFWNKT